MVFDLSTAAAGDIVTQFNGPLTGVNYGGTNPAYCEVVIEQTGGSGASVKVQYNISPISGVDDTQRMAIPDPTQWVDVATINTVGLTQQTVTARANLNWLRVVVVTPGTGKCKAGGRWAKRGA